MMSDPTAIVQPADIVTRLRHLAALVDAGLIGTGDAADNVQIIQKLEDANRQLRAELGRALTDLGREHDGHGIEQLRGAIRRYGRHLSYCPVVTRGSDCDCGLDRWTA